MPHKVLRLVHRVPRLPHFPSVPIRVALVNRSGTTGAPYNVRPIYNLTDQKEALEIADYSRTWPTDGTSLDRWRPPARRCALTLRAPLHVPPYPQAHCLSPSALTARAVRYPGLGDAPTHAHARVCCRWQLDAARALLFHRLALVQAST